MSDRPPRYLANFPHGTLRGRDAFSAASGTCFSANQGTIHYDADGLSSNDATRPTDDPGTPAAEDPTIFFVLPSSALEIPTLGPWALWLLALLLAGLGVVRVRQ